MSQFNADNYWRIYIFGPIEKHEILPSVNAYLQNKNKPKSLLPWNKNNQII